MSLSAKVVTRVFQLNLRNNVSNIRQRTCSVILQQPRQYSDTIFRPKLFDTKQYFYRNMSTNIAAAER